MVSDDGGSERIHFRCPPWLVDVIDEQVERGRFTSRSGAIRAACRAAFDPVDVEPDRLADPGWHGSRHRGR